MNYGEINYMAQNNLFTEISEEESATIKGGGFLEAAAYLIVMQSLFPFIAYSPEVINTALLFLTGVLSFPQNNNTNPNNLSKDN
ncbi:hypothetical protein [Cylindrospermopsis raciborskii]|nr:hypothetical protein [Cylindrospermopsis raciborskii]